MKEMAAGIEARAPEAAAEAVPEKKWYDLSGILRAEYFMFHYKDTVVWMEGVNACDLIPLKRDHDDGDWIIHHSWHVDFPALVREVCEKVGLGDPDQYVQISAKCRSHKTRITLGTIEEKEQVDRLFHLIDTPEYKEKCREVIANRDSMTTYFTEAWRVKVKLITDRTTLECDFWQDNHLKQFLLRLIREDPSAALAQHVRIELVDQVIQVHLSA